MISSTASRYAALSVFLTLLASDVIAGERLPVELVSIDDGNTISVRALAGPSSHRVRLAAIYAPKQHQSYGAQAKSVLSQLLRSAGRLTVDGIGTDQPNPVAMVFDEQGRNINLIMVNQGAAWVYRPMARNLSGYSDFLNAEASAKQRRMGLWTDVDPVEPWLFRGTP